MPDKFSYVKRGYDPAAVDRYIEMLEMELRNHKAKDAVINNAIVSAQQAADAIVKNAKNQGRAMRANTAKQLEDLTIAISGQKQWLSDFAQEYNNVVSKYLQIVNNDDFQVLNTKIDALEGFLRSFSEEVNEDLEMENQAEAAQ